MILNMISYNNIKKLFTNGFLYTKPSDLSRLMNQFFIDKVKNFRQNLPPNRSDPLQHVSKLMKNRKCNFKLKFVHPDQIYEIISKMKNSKTVGIDNIDSFIIKLVASELTPAITHIVNLSIQSGKFPKG